MWATPDEGLKYESAFRAATTAHQLPAGLLSRVAYQESRYNPDAYNAESGASGIMQIVPRFHPGVDPWMPLAAIDYAGGYLRSQFDRFGSWSLALAAYNAGPGRVEQYGGIPPFPETVQYVREILADVVTGPGAGAALVLGILFLFLVR